MIPAWQRSSALAVKKDVNGRELGVNFVNKVSEIAEVLSHIGVQTARPRIRLKVDPTRPSNVSNGLHHGCKSNGTFPQKVRIVLEVELANAILAQPADLFHHVESRLGRIADVVVHKNVLRARHLHQTN